VTVPDTADGTIDPKSRSSTFTSDSGIRRSALPPALALGEVAASVGADATAAATSAAGPMIEMMRTMIFPTRI